MTVAEAAPADARRRARLSPPPRRGARNSTVGGGRPGVRPLPQRAAAGCVGAGETA